MDFFENKSLSGITEIDLLCELLKSAFLEGAYEQSRSSEAYWEQGPTQKDWEEWFETSETNRKLKNAIKC